MRRTAALLLLPILLGGCVDLTLGLNGGPAHRDTAYLRAYNDVGSDVTYADVPKVLTGGRVGVGLTAAGKGKYAALRYIQSSESLHAKALDAQEQTVETFRLVRSGRGVELEAGSLSGWYGSIGVERRQASGSVARSYVPPYHSITGSGRGYALIVTGGRNVELGPFNLLSVFAGATVPLAAGPGIVPTTVAMENGRRAMGPDPRPVVGLGAHLGLRVTIATGWETMDGER